MRASGWALAAAMALGAARAEEPRWYTQIDNDVFYGTDRWYTSGLRVARLAPREGYALELGVLQEIYTPEAKRPNPIDRPPAARLLATVARHDREGESWRTLEVDAGVQGSAALGRQAQQLVHHVFPAPREHWDQQRSNRFDGQLVFAQTRPLPVSEQAVFNVHYGAVVGNQIDFVHAGVEMRVGSDAAARTLSSPVLRFAATPPVANAEPGVRPWSAFVAVSLRDVMRNQTFLRSPDFAFIDPIERYRYVHRVSTGVTWISRWGTLVFAMAIDSREFVGQRRPDGFGSLALALPL